MVCYFLDLHTLYSLKLSFQKCFSFTTCTRRTSLSSLSILKFTQNSKFRLKVENCKLEIKKRKAAINIMTGIINSLINSLKLSFQKCFSFTTCTCTTTFYPQIHLKISQKLNIQIQSRKSQRGE